MRCSMCKKEFVDNEEVLVEGKGLYAAGLEGDEAVIVTDQAAVFCQDCDRVSRERKTVGKEERPEAGDVGDVSGPTLASTPEETGTRDVDPRDESNPGSEETQLTGDAQTADEESNPGPRDGLDSEELGSLEIDPWKL